jgi:hypoxanthine phosphoribosyltransferase
MADSGPGRETLEVVYSAAAIAERIDLLARSIAEVGLDRLLVVAVLKGSFVFAADLIRALHRAGLSPEIDFISLSSYRDATTSSGRVEIVRDIETEVAGRNVLIVDDILESGRTLSFAKDLIAARGARSVRTCVLLDKPLPRAADIVADYSAFECPDVFVVGYGMDLAHRFRELPFVGRVVRD